MGAILFDQIVDFTGGVNYRADQFQLKKNETPEILNLEIDPRGGLFSRAGFKKKHSTAIVADPADWRPKTMFNYKAEDAPTIMLSTGATVSVGVSDGNVFHSSGSNFTILNTAAATPLEVKSLNGCSFTQWQDTLYMARGIDGSVPYYWVEGDAFASALIASGPTWQPYQAPVGGYMPRAELNIAHANKLFVAYTYEDGVEYPNRVRWSHENRPEDWYQQDFIDITAGGVGITGLKVVDGQLLIFKPKAIYLLMGYDADTFQLVEISTTTGIDFPQQAVEGAGGVFFFDYPQGLFFYNRNGIQNLFERIKPIIDTDRINPSLLEYITCSYINDRLWLSMPFDIDNTGSVPSYVNCNFVFDPSIGQQGAYTLFQTATFNNDSDTVIDGWGMISGIDWRDSGDNAWYLMISADEDFPYVMYVDDYAEVNDDIEAGDDFGDFSTIYKTSWFYDDRYVQNKTFVKTLYVVKEVEDDTEIRVNVYHDFNSEDQVASSTLVLNPISTGGIYGTSTYSTNGSGGVYGTTQLRAGVQLGGRLKTAKAVQLEFVGPTAALTGTPGRAWGINSIAFKYKRRQIRSNK